jgi:hypothetical protein
MSAWKDATSYQRGDDGKTPRVYRRTAGAFRLTVHRHINYAADVWLFTCEPIADCDPLGSKDPDGAQREADARFHLALTEARRA